MSAGFAGLVGLEAVEERLTKALAGGRLHHAMLLSGPRGVGKRSLALRIARGLLCAEGAGAGGCGACGSCHRVERGEHGDLHLLERPAGKVRIPVEQVRGLLDALSRGSVEGRGRVAVIVEAGELGREGQNALLKTLEEPHAGTFLLLTSRRPEQLLETLRSRVERVPVPVQGEDRLRALLAGRGIDGEQAGLRVALSAGSIGRLLELCEPGGLDDLALAEALLRAEGDPTGFTRRVLEGIEAGDEGLRQARRLRIERLLSLALPLAAVAARSGHEPSFEAVDRMLDAGRDLDLGLGAEIVLQGLHRELGRLVRPG